MAMHRLGNRLAAAGDGLALYATVLVLVAIGGLKLTACEAAAIRPLVGTSPLLSWAYALLDPQTFSNLLGMVGLATALLLALAPLVPLAGLGGVPRLVVPDNLKSGIHKASSYEVTLRA